MAKRASDLEAANVAHEETPLVAKVHQSLLDRLMMTKQNAVFALHLGQAARVSFVVVLLCIPLILPKGTIPYISDLVDDKWLSAICLQYIFYIIQGTTGGVCRRCANTLVGLLMAAGVMLLLDFIFPGGSQSSGDLASFVAMMVGCIFVITLPFFNFPLVTLVFALSRFSIWWMQFTNPNTHMYGRLRLELVAWFVGSLACIVATLVPSPTLSRDKAPQLCVKLATTLQQGWVDFNDFFCGEVQSNLKVAQLQANLANVYDNMDKLDKHIQDSWWECLFDRARMNGRIMMQRQYDFVEVAYGRLLDVLNIVSQEDFADTHDQVARQIRKPVVEVTDLACKLLKLCAEFSCDGDINPEEAKELEDLTNLLRDKEVEFAGVYHRAKLEVIRDHDSDLYKTGGQAQEMICEELMDEDSYCFAVTGFCRMVRHNVEDLLAHNNGSKLLPAPKIPQYGTVLGVLYTNPSPLQEEFALKTGMAIILAFLVGYLSSGTILRKYDFMPAYLVALLTKFGSGSALNRSMARLQGMIIGFVSASLCRTLVYDELNLDGIGGSVIMIAALGLLVFGSQFLKFHTVGNSAFVGQLIAVVGTPQLAMRFTEKYDYRANQLVTNAIVTCLIIMACVNNGFGSRVSDRGPQKLTLLWDKLGSMIKDTLSVDGGSMAFAPGEVRKLVAEVKHLGSEAAEEPRYWRNEWRTALFYIACDVTDRIRLSIRTIEAVGSTNPSGCSGRSDLFQSVLRMQSFQELVKIVIEQHEYCREMFVIFSLEAKGRPLDDFAKKLEANTSASASEWGEKRQAFIKSMNEPDKLRELAQKSYTPRSRLGDFQHSLDTDLACQVSRVVLNLDQIRIQIMELQNELIMKSRC